MTSQYDTFFYWLGQLESGDAQHPETVQPKEQCRKIENSTGKNICIGKYQLSENILQELKYYKTSNVAAEYLGLWKGKWLGRRGINSLEDFLYNCDAQEFIIREEMNFLWGQIRLNKLDSLVGTTEGVLITESGLLAGAHMFGISGLIYLLQKLKNLDLNERNLLALLKAFSGFQTPYSKISSQNHAHAEFIRYIKSGLSPRIAESALSIPQEMVSAYIWKTQGDDRVRDSHAENEGITFDENDPPATGNPGEDNGCRCWAELCISSDYFPYHVKDFSDPPRLNAPAFPQNLSISLNGVKYIARWEGFSPKTYLDSAQHPTIGYGHLLKPGEAYPDGISRDEALGLLKNETAIAENAVKQNVTTTLTQNQYDALVSFAYNVGVSAFEQSTLLNQLNQSNYSEAAEQFLRWNKVTVDGKVTEDPGLSNRRISEKELFETGNYD